MLISSFLCSTPELHGIDRTILMWALKFLEHKGELAIFKGTSADDEGVKFSVTCVMLELSLWRVTCSFQMYYTNITRPHRLSPYFYGFDQWHFPLFSGKCYHSMYNVRCDSSLICNGVFLFFFFFFWPRIADWAWAMSLALKEFWTNKKNLNTTKLHPE
jgi:hypothetical protein